MFVHSIDLHYHAGQERQPGLTLRDYLEHARVTGRKWIGLTDHINLYLDEQRHRADSLYDCSAEGLLQYRRDVDRLRSEYEDLTVFFAPELHPAGDWRSLPASVLEVSDYLIFEVGYVPEARQENTEAYLAKLAEIRRFRDETGIPGYLAHPFRNAVNARLVKQDIARWVTNLEPLGSVPTETLNDFFSLDVPRLGNAAAELDVALEVNGNTYERVRAINLTAPLYMLHQAYGLLHAAGADLVPGSDQHAFMKKVGRGGGFVPEEVFERLGCRAEDIRFLHHLAGAAQNR